MAKTTALPPAGPLKDDEHIALVQDGANRRSNLAAITDRRGIVGAGTIAAREAYTYRHGGEPDVAESAVWFGKEPNGSWRPYVWVTEGNAHPSGDGSLATYTGWHGLKTQREMNNLAIDFWNLLPQANVANLESDFTRYDTKTLNARISDFRARALSSGETVQALLTWDGNADQWSLAFNGYTLAIGGEKRSLDTRLLEWAAQKELIAFGDSMLDAKWVEGAATAASLTLTNASHYSIGDKQAYNAGVRELCFSTAGNVIPASGTGVQVTSINGVAPSDPGSFDPFAAHGFLNTFAGDTIATNCSEVGTLGGRHGVVSVPNAGTPTYTFTADDSVTEATLLDPQSVFVPDNLAILRRGRVLIRLSQNVALAGPDNPAFPNNINPRVLEDIQLLVDQTGGQQVDILSLTPGSDFQQWAIDAILYFNAQLQELFPGRAAYIPGVGNNYDYIRANGSDGSANDIADIAAGKMPRSCLEDTLHFNAKGQALERAFWEEWGEIVTKPPAITSGTLFTLGATAANERSNLPTTATSSAFIDFGREADTQSQVDALNTVTPITADTLAVSGATYVCNGPLDLTLPAGGGKVTLLLNAAGVVIDGNGATIAGDPTAAVPDSLVNYAITFSRAAADAAWRHALTYQHGA